MFIPITVRVNVFDLHTFCLTPFSGGVGIVASLLDGIHRTRVSGNAVEVGKPVRLGQQLRNNRYSLAELVSSSP